MGDSKRNNIYLVGGSKGGVGKSMVSMAVVDMLADMGQKILLVESDTANPDTWKAHKEQHDAILIDLDKGDGWVELVNICNDKPEHVVVINTAARNNKGVSQYGVTLQSTLAELQRRLVTLWVVNRQRDSLELLRDYLDAITEGDTHVIRNGYFGSTEKFELFNNSKIRQVIEERGGKSLTLPDLADRVSDDLYSKRLSISAAMRELPIGNRAELMRWRAETRKALGAVIE